MNIRNGLSGSGHRELWIGLVGVVPKPDCKLFHDDVAGAYATMLSVALDEAEFMDRVRDACDRLHLEVFEIEECDTYSSRVTSYHISPNVRRLAKEAADGSKVGIARWHTFSKEATS